jgi:hypothetical protein
LTFRPQSGPIKLFSRNSEYTHGPSTSTGPIDLFDGQKYTKTISPMPIQPTSMDPIIEPAPSLSLSTHLVNVEGESRNGMWAPQIKDNEKFNFDWPSEEIRQACETYFVKDQDWKLPVLNWIAAEESGEEMDIQ